MTLFRQFLRKVTKSFQSHKAFVRHFALACLGQACFNSKIPLPALGKLVSISKSPCLRWANVFSFFKCFARFGQMCFYFKRLLPALGKQFIFPICLCPRWARRLFFLFALAHLGQACFNFKTPLRRPRKRVFVFEKPCADCANTSSFFKNLARLAQAVYFFILPLRIVRKAFIFLFHVCAGCARLFFPENIFARCAQALFWFISSDFEPSCILFQINLLSLHSYSERKQALTSPNYHIEDQRSQITFTKSVCALCAGVSAVNVGCGKPRWCVDNVCAFHFNN